MLDKLLGVWKRRKWVTVAAFSSSAALVVGLVMALPNMYTSTVTVLVERQQVPEAVVRSSIADELETRLHTTVQEVLSRSRLADLIARLNLYPQARARATMDDLVQRMRNDISLVMKKDERPTASGAVTWARTVAFTVGFRGNDPVTVTQVANSLASLFIAQNSVRARQATGTADFLRAQLEETKRQLDSQERQVSEYSRKHLGELPQQMASNVAALDQLANQLRLNGDRQTLATARREAMERQLADAESTATRWAAIAPGSVVETPAVRLARLRQELSELRAKYTDKYPEVIRVQTEIASLERAYRDTNFDVATQDPTVRRFREALAEVDAEIKALKNDERRLQETINRYQARVERTPLREQEFQELSRDYQSTKDHYQTLLKRYQEAQLVEEMEQRQKGEHFSILDAALVPGRPIAPNRRRLLLVGIMLSAALAAAVAFLAEKLDSSFHTLDDLRAFTRVPVLVNIPNIITPGGLALRRRRFRLAAALILLSLPILYGAAHFYGRGNEVLVWMLSRGGRI
jgi:polysaccharide chain length determinant protein (PEP-CTERM system associated)